MQTGSEMESDVSSSVDIPIKNGELAETFRLIYNLLGLWFVLSNIIYIIYSFPHAPHIPV